MKIFPEWLKKHKSVLPQGHKRHIEGKECPQRSMFSQEPPPPRYVLQTSTGKWKKQSCSPSTGFAKEAGSLQNSLDYFLKKAMYASVYPSVDASMTLHCLPAEILKELEEFELKHCLVSSRCPSFAVTFLETNPILGLLSGVPLYDICSALARKKGSSWKKPREEWSGIVPLRLSFGELYDVCSELVPNMVSREYVHQMFTSLLETPQDNSLLLSAFFSFLVEHAFHPVLDRNVQALFRAFDPDGTGVISAATLTSKVVYAWSELHLFGNLRGEWEKMAAALELTNGVSLRIVDDARLLTPEATRAVFCASRTLYTLLESIDMNGSHLKLTA